MPGVRQRNGEPGNARKADRAAASSCFATASGRLQQGRLPFVQLTTPARKSRSNASWSAASKEPYSSLASYASSVFAVRQSPDVADPLEPVEHARGGAGGEAAAYRQLTGAHGAGFVQKVEAAQVGSIDAEARCDQLVIAKGGAHLRTADDDPGRTLPRLDALRLASRGQDRRPPLRNGRDLHRARHLELGRGRFLEQTIPGT